jgi:hypothetical protein
MSALTYRWFLCTACHNPSRGPLQGGSGACEQCRAPNALRDRSWITTHQKAPSQEMNAPARIQALRVQDGRPTQVPPGVQALLGGTSVMPGRQQEAIIGFQMIRQRAASQDIGAGEELTILTQVLVQDRSIGDRPNFEQALAESALDAVVLPRHRQTLLGRLCRSAVRGGRLEEGKAWLWMMDACAQDLESDSEYRLGAAFVATAERNAQHVVFLVGSRKDEIPIHDSMDPMASVLRANAFEMLGNVQQASNVLASELADAHRSFQAIAQFNAALNLCPVSGAAFRAQAAQAGAMRVQAQSGGSAGTILRWTGLGVAGMGVFVTLILLVTSAGAGGGFALLSMMAGAVPTLLVTGAVGVGLYFWGKKMEEAAKRAAYIRMHGTEATAVVQNATHTGLRVNHVPQMMLHLLVRPPNGPPFAATTKLLIPDHQIGQMMGKELPVRFDPQNPTEVVLEM